MAKIEIVKKVMLGKNALTMMVTGEDFKSTALEYANLSFGDIDKCGIPTCGSDDLALGAHKTKDGSFEYVYIRCKKCRATLNFGEQKKADVVYYRTRQEPNGKKVLDWMEFKKDGEISE